MRRPWRGPIRTVGCVLLATAAVATVLPWDEHLRPARYDRPVMHDTGITVLRGWEHAHIGLAWQPAVLIALLITGVAVALARRARVTMPAMAAVTSALAILVLARTTAITANGAMGYGLAVADVALPVSAACWLVLTASGRRAPRAPSGRTAMISVVLAGLSAWAVMAGGAAVRAATLIRTTTVAHLTSPAAGPVPLTAAPTRRMATQPAAVGDGVIVTATGNAAWSGAPTRTPWSGITVYDGATGRERWQVQRRDRLVQEAAVGHRVVVTAADDAHADHVTLTGYDAWTGRPRWTNHLPFDLPFAGASIVNGRLALMNAGSVGYYDLTTGRHLATITMEPRCRLTNVTGDGSRTYTAQVCLSGITRTIVLSAYDASARRLWRSPADNVPYVIIAGYQLTPTTLDVVGTRLIFQATGITMTDGRLRDVTTVAATNTGSIERRSTWSVYPHIADGLILTTGDPGTTTVTASTAPGKRSWTASVPGTPSLMKDDGDGLLYVYSSTGETAHLTALRLTDGHRVAQSPALHLGCPAACDGHTKPDDLTATPGLVELTFAPKETDAKGPTAMFTWAK